MFVYWYLIRFVGESPFSHSALDIKTFAMCLLGTGYRDSTKRDMPKRWFNDIPHTVALDDAIGQGALFCNMLRQSLTGCTNVGANVNSCGPSGSTQFGRMAPRGYSAMVRS
jgi:hypothetical protein